jgi:hypothetical protein
MRFAVFLAILMASLVGYATAQSFVQAVPYTLTNEQRQNIGLIMEDIDAEFATKAAPVDTLVNVLEDPVLARVMNNDP